MAGRGTRFELADVLGRHGEAFRRAHEGRLGRVERRVMAAIEACRTGLPGRPRRSLRELRLRSHRLQFLPYGQIQ